MLLNFDLSSWDANFLRSLHGLLCGFCLHVSPCHFVPFDEYFGIIFHALWFGVQFNHQCESTANMARASTESSLELFIGKHIRRCKIIMNVLLQLCPPGPIGWKIQDPGTHGKHPTKKEKFPVYRQGP